MCVGLGGFDKLIMHGTHLQLELFLHAIRSSATFVDVAIQTALKAQSFRCIKEQSFVEFGTHFMRM
ncbi:hypothetical protein D3C72_2577510 [compost metagenome]